MKRIITRSIITFCLAVSLTLCIALVNSKAELFCDDSVGTEYARANFLGDDSVMQGAITVVSGTRKITLVGPGGTVVNSFATIQAAINAASAGQTIIVPPGTYKESIDFKGKAVALRSINPCDVPTVEATIIDGDHKNTVVAFVNQEGPESVLCGFTIQNGKSTYGGGIFCYRSSPTIFCCIVTHNESNTNGNDPYTGNGGGIYCLDHASPWIVACRFSSNAADLTGAGICFKDKSAAIIEWSCISNNTVMLGGGGICCWNTDDQDSDKVLVIANCSVSSNTAVNMDGGGIFCYENSSPVIYRCTVADNISSKRNGGGINCSASSVPGIFNCLIRNNEAAGSGGGIACELSSSPGVGHCTIVANKSGGAGGGIACAPNQNCCPTITNSIVWFNKKGNESDNILVDFACNTVTCSDIQVAEGSVFPGSGNINQDPLFSDEDGHLNSGSPCIDKGDCFDFINEDIEGIPRPQGEGCDMGAHESGGGGSGVLCNYDPVGIEYARANFLGDDSAVQGAIILASGSNRIILAAPNGAVINAFGTIQAAINAASAGQTIIVPPGTYKENIDFKGKAVTLRSINPCDLPTIEATVIDGDQKNSVVAFVSQEGPESVLCGFTIQNGKSNYGGGIFCHRSSPTIFCCIVAHNESNKNGNDSYTGNGGGVYCMDHASPMIVTCWISGNLADLSGAGICCRDISTAVIEWCCISNNTVTAGGAGICCWNTTDPDIGDTLVIANCFIFGNTAANTDGGGILCYENGSPVIYRCTIAGNISAKRNGGGISCSTHSVPAIFNCFIKENEAAGAGGGIACELSSSPGIGHCTIVANRAAGGSAGIACTSGQNCCPGITDSIIWFNTRGGVADNILVDFNCSTVTYSDIQVVEGAVFPGTGNINQDPLFNDEEGRLNSGSPCIDAGDCVDFINEDIYGLPRPQGRGCDMGAHESAGEPGSGGGPACVCVENDQGEVDIEGSYTAVPGGDLRVPVRIQYTPAAINSFQFDLIYDSRALEYAGIERGDLTAYFDGVDANPFIADGAIRIGGYARSQYSIPEGANGILVYVKFKVRDDLQEDCCYPLELKNLKDNIKDLSSSGACVCTTHCCNGDLNGDGDVTPGDALIAFECALGKGECGPCFDVNMDGDVTPGDALCIFQKALGMPNCIDDCMNP